jgi:hypothetical protein
MGSPCLKDGVNGAFLRASNSLKLVHKDIVRPNARFDAFRAVKIQAVVFWVVTPCSVVVGTNVSDANTASIFRVKTEGVILQELH